MKGLSIIAAAGLVLAAAGAGAAEAAEAQMHVSGAGISADLTLTWGDATDARYPGAFKVTGISGKVSVQGAGKDRKLAIEDAMAGPLVATDPVPPSPSAGKLAPHEFSRFKVASGLAAKSHGVLTYDNLIWPDQAPRTAEDNPNHGGILDFYGLMFGIGDGRYVNLWCDGSPDGKAPTYGYAVVTHDKALAYVGGGVTVTLAQKG